MTAPERRASDARLRRILLLMRGTAAAIEEGASLSRRSFSIGAWLRRNRVPQQEMSQLREDGANEGMATVARLFVREIDQLLMEETGEPAPGLRPYLAFARDPEQGKEQQRK